MEPRHSLGSINEVEVLIVDKDGLDSDNGYMCGK
jgi:hypothetical protein